jgi:hypothetical protein
MLEQRDLEFRRGHGANFGFGIRDLQEGAVPSPSGRILQEVEHFIFVKRDINQGIVAISKKHVVVG